MKRFLALTLTTLFVAGGCAEATGESDTRELHIEPDGEELRVIVIDEFEIHDFSVDIEPVEEEEVECTRDGLSICTGQVRRCENGEWGHVAEYQETSNICGFIQDEAHIDQILKCWFGVDPDDEPGPRPDELLGTDGSRTDDGATAYEGTWTREWTQEETQPSDDGRTDDGRTQGGTTSGSSSTSSTSTATNSGPSGNTSGNTQPARNY